MNVAEITHPLYDSSKDEWEKFRFVFEGGRAFIEEYLIKFSVRESTTDFADRAAASYSPSHSKAALWDVKNAIYQRMHEIIRKEGSKSFLACIDGSNGGVDNKGTSINSFIGTEVLPELLALGKVGVYIDRPMIPAGASRADAEKQRPYLYLYKAEDIKSWHIDVNGTLTAVLLRYNTWNLDEDTGLVTESKSGYRLLRLTKTGVDVSIFHEDGTEESKVTLSLTQIPFVVSELSQSLLTDIADHQIALLNLASSDLMYALKSNFPFYTEQFDMGSDAPHLRPEGEEGDTGDAQASKDKKIKVGSTQGRRYPRGLDRPGFISPSAEPLVASMKKQSQIKAEIRQLIALTLTNLEPTHASADSKRQDLQGLEAGLSYIGLELEWAERRIAEIWSEYEGNTSVTHIRYPRNYSLKTESDRRTEANELLEILPQVPSKTFQKETAKQIASVLYGNRIQSEILGTIHEEIDGSEIIATDPEIVRSDHEAGFVSTATASKLRGYDEKEVEQAKIDHAERLARIAEAQSKDDGAARGVPDAGSDPDAGSKEKEVSRQTDIKENTKEPVRGEGT